MRDRLQLIPAVSFAMTPARLPQSSKKVMKILDSGRPMTQKDLVKKTNLHPRTVRFALKKLKEQQLLIEKLKMDDLRQIIYQIRFIEDQKIPLVT
jgi:predicted transcriptional regulator